MPDQFLFLKGSRRWLSAGVMLAVSAALIATHIWRTVGQDDGDTAALVGSDTAFAARLFEGRTGLGIRLGQEQRAALMRLIARNPMNSSAIAVLAMDRQAKGDAAGALALGDRAIRIEPRTRLAWLARLDRQMRQRDTVGAATSVIRLLTFDYLRAAVYLPILVNLVKDPQTIPVVSKALAENPGWRSPLVGLLALGKVDPAIRYALMNPDKQGAAADVVGDRSLFLGDMAGKGDYERAYLAWLSFLPDSALDKVGLPYDGSFDALPGPAPFNWQLSSADGDRAAIDGGMLQISYSGRKPVTLARQTVLLEPGDYRLDSVVGNVGGQGSASGSTLTWNVRCLPNYTLLAAMPINANVAGQPQRSVAFSVPATTCPAIALQLDGAAAEFPSRLSLDMASVQIKRNTSVASSVRGPEQLDKP